MDFQLTEEQQMLKDSARRYLEETCAFDVARARLVAQGSYDPVRWQALAELGWLGMSLPEQFEGLGGSPIETALLAEEMGRVLCVEPYWAVAVLAAQTIAAAGDVAQAAALLPALVAGHRRPVLAHGEAEARGSIEYVASTATPAGEGRWTLRGRKTLVVGANAADSFIVSVRTSGAVTDRHGLTMFVLNRNTPGLGLREFRLVDNRWAGDLVLDDAVVDSRQMLGQVDEAFGALATGHAHALVALCSEAVGVMEKSLWITRDYLKTRKQFGVTLSSFQSVQHRMSEMLIELELARSMVYRALAQLDAPGDQAEQALSSMKVHVGASGKFVCAQAIQLHGGIGVTEEYVIGHYFKRMTAIENALGSSYAHLEKLAEVERRACV